jgi:hypothetical protein
VVAAAFLCGQSEQDFVEPLCPYCCNCFPAKALLPLVAPPRAEEARSNMLLHAVTC